MTLRPRRTCLAVAALAPPGALAHVHDPRLLDLICTTTDATPGLALVPFALLVVVGAWRAIARPRRDR